MYIYIYIHIYINIQLLTQIPPPCLAREPGGQEAKGLWGPKHVLTGLLPAKGKGGSGAGRSMQIADARGLGPSLGPSTAVLAHTGW